MKDIHVLFGFAHGNCQLMFISMLLQFHYGFRSMASCIVEFIAACSIALELCMLYTQLGATLQVV